jgi:hypothetical protein
MRETLSLAIWHSCGSYEVEYAQDYFFRKGRLVGRGKGHYTGRVRRARRS